MKKLFSILLLTISVNLSAQNIVVQGRKVTIVILTPVAIDTSEHQYDYSFRLTSTAKVSVGMYKKRDSTLVRTLISGKTYTAGLHTEHFDGYSDDPTVLLPADSYFIRVIDSRFIATWEGARIGNTSTALTGSTKHRLFQPARSMVTSGTNVFVAGGYAEGWPAQYRFDTTTPGIKSWVGLLAATDQGTDFIATDGIRVYWGGYDPLQITETFVFATYLSNNGFVSFSTGVPASMMWGHTYTSTISYRNAVNTIITGLDVQKTGNFLFTSRNGSAELECANKLTGAAMYKMNFPNITYVKIDRSDNLWAVHGDTLEKYTINATTGIITTTGIRITSISTLGGFDFSPDGTTVTVCDINQQVVKSFNTTTGAASWTLGTSGGYLTNSTVSNDKFYFRDPRETHLTFVAYQADGSFYVGDPGNYRMQHYNADRTFANRIMSIGTIYNTFTDPNDSTRLFVDLLEFEMNYTQPLETAWTLKRNWGGNFLDTYNRGNFLIRPVTLSNGRTYAQVRIVNNYPVVELVPNGVLRATNVTFLQRQYIHKSGIKIWNPGAQVGLKFQLLTYPLTGFDGSNNPIWSTTSNSLTQTPVIDSFKAVPWEGFRGDILSDDNKIVYFDYTREERGHGKGYHLGMIPRGGTEYKWQTAYSTAGNASIVNSTRTGYAGPMPADGWFDSYNGVIYPGGSLLMTGKLLFQGYHGEFWKQSQTNIWNMFDLDTGLFIDQFGVNKNDYPVTEEAPYFVSGNVLTGSLVKMDTCLYLYYNDEGIHNGSHRVRITGDTTLHRQDAVWPADQGADTLAGVDLMLGLNTAKNIGFLNSAGWTRYPATDILVNPSTNYWLATLGGKTYHHFKPTDIFALYRQNSGNYYIRKDLGTNTGLTTWQFSGLINYESNTPTQSAGLAGQYLQILDNAGRVIARFDLRRNGSTGNWEFKCNNQLMYSGTAENMSTFTSKARTFSITYSSGSLTFAYDNYTPVTTTVKIDTLSNWGNPTTISNDFFNNSGSGDNFFRVVDLSELRFATSGF